jgi:hypothetical protein
VTSNVLPRLVRAGFLAAFVYGSTVTRLFQGVASTLLGPAAFEGGTTTAAVGVLMHVGVAFGWSTVFLFLTTRSAWLRRQLTTSLGVAKVASVYGPFVWLVMSLAVIPILTERPPAITVRWWVQLIGHIPFVGLPIVAATGHPTVER